MKRNGLFISLITLFFVTSCGGGGSDGGGPIAPPPPPPPPPPPTALTPLPIDSANANSVIQIDAVASQYLLELGDRAIDLILLLTESGSISGSFACGSGTVDATLADSNGNGLPTSGETATLVLNSCDLPVSGDSISGTMELLVRSFVVDSGASAKMKLRVSIPTPAQIDFAGGTADVSGDFELDYLGDSSLQVLEISNLFGDEILVETTQGAVTTNDTIKKHEVSRRVDTNDNQSIVVALEVASETLTGKFVCATLSPLESLLQELPESGQLECTGADGSAARATGSAGGMVVVSVDDTGGGSFVDVGVIGGGQGLWTDFFVNELFSFLVRSVGIIPDQVIPEIGSVSIAMAVVDAVVSSADGTIYVSNDTGISAIDPASMTVVDQVALADRPGPLAVSEDGSVIWVGFRDSEEIQSVAIPSLVPGPRVSLGVSAVYPERKAAHIRVVPGSPQTVVVGMLNDKELVAYANDTALTNIVDDVLVPKEFEFSDASTLVGLNTNAPSPVAAVISLDATGLVLVNTLAGYELQANTSLDIAGGSIFTTSGRVFDATEEVIEGRVKLDQVIASTDRDGVSVDSGAGIAYFYDSANELLDSYFQQTLVLRSAHIVRSSGNFVNIIHDGSYVYLVTDSEVRQVGTTALTNNRNMAPCQTLDLSGQISSGFFAQIECGFNDILYDPVSDVIYASLPSFSGKNGNTIAAIDPNTGLTLSNLFVGSEPGQLSISGDSRSLYVALNASTRVAKIDLQSNSVSSYVNLEVDTVGASPVFATVIAVAPLDDTQLLVGADGELSLYSGGVRASNVVTSINSIRDIIFLDDGSSAIVHSSDNSLADLTISADGVTLGSADDTVVTAGSLKFQDDTLYDRDGRVVDATTRILIGLCSPTSPGGSHLVEPGIDSSLVFYVDMAIDAELAICDETTFSIQKEAAIPSFGNFSSLGRALVDAGGGRLAMPSNDMLIIFDSDAL